MSTLTVELARRVVGRRNRILRVEMTAILVALGKVEIDLRCDRSPAPYDLHDAARAWVNACNDMTCISVITEADGLHGRLQREELGAPSNDHVGLFFVSTAATRRGTEQLRERCDGRLFVVIGGQLRDSNTAALARKLSAWTRERADRTEQQVLRIDARHARAVGDLARLLCYEDLGERLLMLADMLDLRGDLRAQGEHRVGCIDLDAHRSHDRHSPCKRASGSAHCLTGRRGCRPLRRSE